MSAKILIADDYMTKDRKREVLGKSVDYDGLGASNKQQALDAILQQRPDLVLLDVMMPKKSGFDVLQAVREHDELAGLRILMLTAKGRDTDMAKGLALGADDYMTKPFSTRELVDKVRALLGAGA